MFAVFNCRKEDKSYFLIHNFLLECKVVISCLLGETFNRSMLEAAKFPLCLYASFFFLLWPSIVILQRYKMFLSLSLDKKWRSFNYLVKLNIIYQNKTTRLYCVLSENKQCIKCPMTRFSVIIAKLKFPNLINLLEY